MKNNGDYIKYYIGQSFLDKETSLYANRMLSCVRCKELTPVECSNCGYSNFYSGTDKDGFTGIFCEQCKVGIVRWTCEFCQTQNPINDETVYFKKKKGCFIATAAYGSPLAPELLFFYRFRDEVLLTSKLGSCFVKSYYFVAPPIASLISKAEVSRSATRYFLLAPMLRVAKFTLKKGEN